MGRLYTIGHSTHEQQTFISLLKKYAVSYVIDVRSTPYSQYAEQFNRDHIRSALSQEQIGYSFMGKFFGARQNDDSLYHPSGYLDFEKVRNSANFNTGFAAVIRGLDKGSTIALMCTEKDPFDCHRAIMVARAFDLAGIQVDHIKADGEIQTQQQLDERLLDKYFPMRAQMSFLTEGLPQDEKSCLSCAYQKRNEEIGFRKNGQEQIAI